MTDAPDPEETLAATVRRLAAARPEEPSPRVISRDVLDSIRPGQERDVLAALLPRYVSDVLRRAENAPSGDPTAAWAALLSERVPTDHGYQFLRDCTAEDVRSGAQRRRRFADGLTRRAELYESMADRIEVENADTADALTPEAATELVITARGYVPPMGRRISELPAALRPTVNQILDELSALPPEVVARQLADDPDLAERVALADARGWAPAELARLLRSDDVIVAFHDGLGRVQVNLAHRSRMIRLTGESQEKRKHIVRDLTALQHRQSEIRPLYEEALERLFPQPPRRPRRDPVLTSLIDEDREQFYETLNRALNRAGLPATTPVHLPPIKESWEKVLSLGLAQPNPEVAWLLTCSPQRFAEIVADDAAGETEPGLRDFDVAARWGAALVDALTDVTNQPPAADDVRAARRSRFIDALGARRTEVRRVLMARHARAAWLLYKHNRTPERHRVIDEVGEQMLKKAREGRPES